MIVNYIFIFFKRERLLNQPHYLILVDSKFSDKFQAKSYVAQEQIEVLTKANVC
jgi:hypothetical protein